MPFVLKEVDDESSEVKIYAGTVKIGSKDNCDLVIKSQFIKPLHAELYHQMPEYRLAGTHSAFIEINDKEVLRWPAVLNDGDVITLGDKKFSFNIIQSVINRSKKAAFSAYLAAILMLLLLIFELLVMFWLPYKLKENKILDTSAARQYTIRQVDLLRNTTRSLQVPPGNENIQRLKTLLLATEDNIAGYLREYGEKMNLDQAITVRTQLNYLNSIVKRWPEFAKQFQSDSKINIKTYIDNLVKELNEKMKE